MVTTYENSGNFYIYIDIDKFYNFSDTYVS